MLDKKQAQEALTKGCKELGLQDDVIVTEIKKNGRWTLAYLQNKDMPAFHRGMIKLERWLKKELNYSLIELMCESLADKNKRALRNGVAVPKMVNARGVESLD